MFIDLLEEIDRYLCRVTTLQDLETWLLENLQRILNSGDVQAMTLANQLDADLIDLREGLLDTAGFRAFRTTMVLFVLAGFVGVALHFRGAAEFQLDLDPSIGRWDLVKKVMRVKDPPILAPGVMLQLGLMGLAYAYGNPGAAASEGGTKKERSG